VVFTLAMGLPLASSLVSAQLFDEAPPRVCQCGNSKQVDQKNDRHLLPQS